ncbi:MAG: hypothetical protein ACXU9J_05470, partial [Syntrophales bacterium]
MKDQEKTKEALIREVDDLRSRIAELEKSDAERAQAEEALAKSLENLKKATGFIIDVIVMIVETRDPYMSG